MIRRLLKILLLGQVLLAGLIALLIHALGWVGSSAALATGLALVLLLRLALTLNNFRLARRHALRPAPALGWRRRARMLAREFFATLFSSSWTMVRRQPHAHHFNNEAMLPVLLVHGYGCNGGYWQSMRAALAAARISHHAFDLEPALAAIDDYVPAIAAARAALSRAHGGRPVVLLGHSMGGLAARATLRIHGAAGVAHVITLGTPHFGTALAAHGVGLNCWQMCGSLRDGAWQAGPWLRELDAHEDAARRALFTSIYSVHDNIVAPPDAAILPGAHNIALEGVGHVALALDPAVQRQVIARIAAVSKCFSP